MALAARTRRFSVEEYDRMADAGILKPDDRVELIEGEIVEMAPIGPAHAVCVDRLNGALGAALRDRAGDILLLIEVADTSLEYDRRRKISLYAAAGVQEVGLVNLPRQAIEVYREPRDGEYRDVRTFVRGQALAAGAFSDVILTVDNILG